MLARVSHVEAFRRWRQDEEGDLPDLLGRLRGSEAPSPAMLAGTAFHKALEEAEPGEHGTLSALGHTFHLLGGEVPLAPIREVRGRRDYGGLTVTGQADVIHGRTVIDHKTTRAFDAEGYIGGCQWRFYLGIFGADVFRWNVFTLREVGELAFEAEPPHVLTAYRYPELEDDCLALAAEFLAFAEAHWPEGWQP